MHSLYIIYWYVYIAGSFINYKILINAARLAISIYKQIYVSISYTPVFRRDVLWYGDVRPSVRPSALFLHFSHTCFDIMSWNFAHDFVLMYYRSSLSVVTLRQFLKELCRPTRPSVRPSGSPSARFPHFSHTCFDILSWNFEHDFVLMYYRSSLSVVTLRQFLKELCLFVNLEYR